MKSIVWINNVFGRFLPFKTKKAGGDKTADLWKNTGISGDEIIGRLSRLKELLSGIEKRTAEINSEIKLMNEAVVEMTLITEETLKPKQLQGPVLKALPAGGQMQVVEKPQSLQADAHKEKSLPFLKGISVKSAAFFAVCIAALSLIVNSLPVGNSPHRKLATMTPAVHMPSLPLKKPDGYKSPSYHVQFGAFSIKENAGKLMQSLHLKGLAAYIYYDSSGGRQLYRVLSAPLKSRKAAIEAARMLSLRDKVETTTFKWAVPIPAK